MFGKVRRQQQRSNVIDVARQRLWGDVQHDIALIAGRDRRKQIGIGNRADIIGVDVALDEVARGKAADRVTHAGDGEPGVCPQVRQIKW